LRITLGQANELSGLQVGESYDEFKLIEASPWIEHHKYSSREVIFEYQGKYYKGTDTRAREGSDCFYVFEEVLIEVQKVSITTHKWIPV
jgi:hypothetical protein